jgi:rare lipoprotein A (peptidoglycan hydrolase)
MLLILTASRNWDAFYNNLMNSIKTIKCVLAILLATLASCAQNKQTKATFYQSGIVSHYSIRTNSNSTTTASGVPLNDSLRTAAHKTLPFNTKVRVIREDNPDLQTTVVITDRGPYIAGRVLDVSQAAARDLQMITKGIVKCKLEILD